MNKEIVGVNTKRKNKLIKMQNVTETRLFLTKVVCRISWFIFTVGYFRSIHISHTFLYF